jgi:hypothetical protein
LYTGADAAAKASELQRKSAAALRGLGIWRQVLRAGGSEETKETKGAEERKKTTQYNKIGEGKLWRLWPQQE